MSTRALRKLQREQEIERQMAAAKAAHEEEEDDDSEESADVSISQPKNAFDMLNDQTDDEESPVEGQHSDEDKHTEAGPASGIPPVQTSKSKKKKKKKQKKKKAKNLNDGATNGQESEDEIDRALRELAAKPGENDQHDEANVVSWETLATKLLAIDQKNLNPTNEMRSLFGNIALESHDSTSTPRNQRRRDVNLQGGVDLATALTGRYSIASRGKELGALATRRNCLVQGRTEWPLATSGGLSMEHTTTEDFKRSYDIIHNRQYQEVQGHFRAAVNSMQADQMIGVLMANPYHVATLLQVSEIAKHQGDHSVSGDLLERALFTVGRSVHSSFPSALREGLARLNFNKPSNRELYLAIWRYIRNLEMRGTWRTCFEWAKLLLQFDTLSDPFGVTLMIDQLALRGRQHTQLLELTSDDAYGPTWSHLPNIQISKTLALLRSNKPKEARRQLAIAMHRYPYVLSALASSLEISPMPRALWAKLPSTDAEKLYTELYVTRAKDLWNTPETTALISEVAETMEYYQDSITSLQPAPALEISLEEARHIMLLEIPQLIALLPRRFTAMQTSSSDVLPPPSSQTSDFTSRAPTEAAPTGPNPLQAIFSAAGNAAGAPLQGANGVLQRILNWFHAPAIPNDTDGGYLAESEGQAAFRAMREQLQAANGGEPVTDEMVEQLIRMQLGGHDEEPVTATGLMAGAWDFDDADSNPDDTSSGMPELEDLQSARHPINPHAATVEEADSDEDNVPGGTSGRAVLRHVDSDDEDEAQPRSHPAVPDHTLFTPHTPAATSSPAEPSLSNPDPDNAVLRSNDPQRIQRYLLTIGLSSLQANPATLPHYVERLKLLRKQQQDWIVNMISQRTDGRETADRVKRAI